MNKIYTVSARVWLYPGDAAWHFVTIPTDITGDIDYFFSMRKRGFGSLPVSVTLGKTIWKTSIFPDAKTHTYLLPLKKEVRKKESFEEGDTIEFTLEIEG
jgi:hypothetical protein